MKRIIQWNGFKIKCGAIKTKIGYVPYICYIPKQTLKIVNIAIHGEGQNKEEWLCFNSSFKFGNLLKESIKQNSPFIALDLYGHGDWIVNNKSFTPFMLSKKDKEHLIDTSIEGIQEAIPKILINEKIRENPISLTAYSIGCSVALGLNLKNIDFKSILVEPHNSINCSNCKEFCIIRGPNINNLRNSLQKDCKIEEYYINSEYPLSWINKAKEYIYSA